MESSLKKRKKSRIRRVFRVRKTIKGTKEKPRLSIFKSNKHLFAQLIDDENSNTLVGMSTCSKQIKSKKSKESAKTLGEKFAELAKGKKLNEVIFDRGRYKFHGIIAEFANSARKAGLKF
ncbi:MAG: 50S ribosomal protein L18 [Parachlamydiales bacterium]|nr:50S ribosomal protein L18 [Parachlamydiales bacterium]